MSIRAITATTTQPSANTAPDQFSNLAMEALSQTEQMNNQLNAELNSTMQMFKKMLVDVQMTLDAALKKNELLEKEVIQLNTTIKENETLHAAEMREKTETISTLVESVNQLKNDHRLTTASLTEQKKNFEALASCYNSHSHGFYRRCAFDLSISVPTTRYTPEKK